MHTCLPRALHAMAGGSVCALDIWANINDNITFIEPPRKSCILQLRERLFPIVPKASLLLLPPALVPEVPATGAQEVQALRCVATLCLGSPAPALDPPANPSECLLAASQDIFLGLCSVSEFPIEIVAGVWWQVMLLQGLSYHLPCQIPLSVTWRRVRHLY